MLVTLITFVWLLLFSIYKGYSVVGKDRSLGNTDRNISRFKKYIEKKLPTYLQSVGGIGKSRQKLLYGNPFDQKKWFFDKKKYNEKKVENKILKTT